MKRIIIDSDKETINLKIELLNNPTSEKISRHIPIESRVKTWGDEIYFDTNIKAPVQNATLDVNVGDIAYWPDGRCLCIFYGRTPASSGEKPVPASKVVLIGKTAPNPVLLRKVKPGSKIRVE